MVHKHIDDDSSDWSKKLCLNLDGDHRTVSKKGVDAPHAISYNRARAQHKRKGPTTSSSESLSKHKEILKKLYNISKRIALAKLFEQFNKLLDHST